MKGKKVLIFAVSFCMTLALTGLPFMVSYAKAAAEKTWTLKYQSMTTRGSEDSAWAIDTKFAQLVSDKAKGRVKIELYGTPEIVNWGEMARACEEGTLPMFELQDGPLATDFRGIEWNTTTLRPDWPKGIFDFWEKSGVKDVVARGLAKRNLMVVSYFEWGDGQCIVARKAHVKTMADLKGMKLRIPPGTWVPIFQALGATPAPMPSSELYSALERGVVDGCVTGMDVGLMGWKLYEVAKYLSFGGGRFPPGGSRFIIMNKSLFDSMPKDIQKAILDAGYEVIHPFGIDYINKRTEKILKEFGRITGIPPYIVPNDEVERWIQTSSSDSVKYYRDRGGMAPEIISIWEKYTGKKAP
jgi:TRAP-type C4-dicarboxylate transport system substrate-binding protein